MAGVAGQATTWHHSTAAFFPERKRVRNTIWNWAGRPFTN